MGSHGSEACGARGGGLFSRMPRKSPRIQLGRSHGRMRAPRRRFACRDERSASAWTTRGGRSSIRSKRQNVQRWGDDDVGRREASLNARIGSSFKSNPPEPRHHFEVLHATCDDFAVSRRVRIRDTNRNRGRGQEGYELLTSRDQARHIAFIYEGDLYPQTEWRKRRRLTRMDARDESGVLARWIATRSARSTTQRGCVPVPGLADTDGLTGIQQGHSAGLTRRQGGCSITRRLQQPVCSCIRPFRARGEQLPIRTAGARIRGMAQASPTTRSRSIYCSGSSIARPGRADWLFTRRATHQKIPAACVGARYRPMWLGQRLLPLRPER